MTVLTEIGNMDSRIMCHHTDVLATMYRPSFCRL